MGRGKLALELISKERSRRTTYEKRKKGLIKKAEEFSILCGVDTCVIIYGPDGSDYSVEPTIWPPDHEEVKRIMERYRSEGMDRRAKRTTGLNEFFMARKRNIDNELVKAKIANWKSKYPVMDELISDFNDEGKLTALLARLAARLEMAKKLHSMMKQDALINPGGAMEDLCFASLAHYMQVHDMAPIPAKPLDAKPVVLQYNFSPYLPPPNKDHSTSLNNNLGTMMLKDNDWPLFGLSTHSSLGLTIPDTQEQHDSTLTHFLFQNEARAQSVSMNRHPFSSLMNMSLQTNNLYHCHPGSTSSNNNFHQNLLAGQYQLVDLPVHIDQNGRVIDNMIMLDRSNSSILCYNNNAPTIQPLPPPMLPCPVVQASASMMDASQENHDYDLSRMFMKKIERK